MALPVALVLVGMVIAVFVWKANAARRDNRSVKAYRRDLGRLEQVVAGRSASTGRDEAAEPPVPHES
jgi:hypothetical protein